jgi:hypothetical protein
MKDLTTFCLTLNPEHESVIKRLSYIPVGLGDEKFSKDCFTDKKGENISKKNPNYGEYTFHYWIWKNHLENIKSEWVGFCQYRKFFLKDNSIERDFKTLDSLDENIIKDISADLEDYDCILGEQSYVNNFKFMKFFKQNPLKIIFSPSFIFQKKKRNIKYHFDIFHGDGHLESAISLLDKEHKDDFKIFVETRSSFNPHNMFICKKKYLKSYYETIFPWLKKCEDIFGFKELKGYGKTRIYGFLAERFLSYWFLKNYKVKELPIVVKNISDYKNL